MRAIKPPVAGLLPADARERLVQAGEFSKAHADNPSAGAREVNKAAEWARKRYPQYFLPGQ